jgi:hypothetical protein
MRYQRSERFKKAYKSPPEEIKGKVKKAFTLFQTNPRHHSLRIKKMEGIQGVYEGRIDQN